MKEFASGKTWRIYNCPAEELLAATPSASVGAVVTDPPYGTTEHKWDSAKNISVWFSEWLRVARKNAAVVVFCSGKFTRDCFVIGGGVYRHKYVWRKYGRVNGVMTANTQPLKVHEDVLVFGTAAPAYYPQMDRSERRVIRRGVKGVKMGAQHGEAYSPRTQVYDARHPVDVLDFYHDPPEFNRHPTQKPFPLLLFLVKSYSAPGDLVFDGFLGSGTTAHAAVASGREFVGSDIDPKWCKMAADRCRAAERSPA